jgi:hypothetical protein
MASARRHAGAVTVAATACAGLLVYYLHEHPERFASPTGPEKTSRRRRTRDALHDAGFFTSFGFVAASAVVFELASGKGVSRDWKWRMLIGYVAGNHALYAAHCLYGSARLGETGSEVEDDAGVGAMLRMSSRSAIRALFDEHRLADALVHAGAVVAGGVSLKRLDSLASLCEHLRRYADIKPARRKDETSKKGNAGSIWNRRWRDALAFWVAAAEREVFVSRRIAGTAKRTDATPPRSLSAADVVDVFAHCRTACKVLTFRELAFSLVFAEAARRALRLDLIKHHRE